MGMSSLLPGAMDSRSLDFDKPPAVQSTRRDKEGTKREAPTGHSGNTGGAYSQAAPDEEGGNGGNSSKAPVGSGGGGADTKPSRGIGPLPAFLDRTFAMVDESGSDGIVGWSSSGETFVIKRLDLFEEDVIPRFFNHRNLLSFVRQLNNHGEWRVCYLTLKS